MTATWCFISGLRQKLRVLQNVQSISRNFQTAARVIGGQNLGNSDVQRVLGCSLPRLFHTSEPQRGKKGPKGSKVTKANPLKTKKTNKSIVVGRVHVHPKMTIKELATALNRPTDNVYEALMYLPNTDQFDNDNSALDNATISGIVKKHGMIPEFVSKKDKSAEVEDKDVKRQPPPEPSTLVPRCPVVTIMGHVDHGKTTLLDQLRESNIVDGEFGGITQHIGAFMVTLGSGESICFLDTPGHAAFSAMRSRGAQLTDIVVLVVAADDGVMQQTLESIQHAKQEGVPIIVAINKIDKDNADVGRTKQMLMEHDILLEEFGGDIQAVEVSALKGINLLELQEAIVTQAELMNLQADRKGLVEARVVESRVDDKRGRLATAVIQRGTLKRGDLLIAGTAWGKVRAMFNDLGKPLQSAPPGTPVEILGWRDEIPSAGEEILQLNKESEVKSVLAWRRAQKMEQKAAEDSVVIEEKRAEHHKDYHAELVARREMGFHKRKNVIKTKEVQASPWDEGPRLSFILKGDVDGSVEAILDSMDTYRSTKCHLDVIHYGVGAVTESDVEMAAAFDGVIYAFNTDVPTRVDALAKTKKVPVKRHTIIYRLFEDLKDSINIRLPKVQEDVVIGEAKVLQVYQVTLPNKKKASVAGCRCTSGNISKKFNVKVIRDDEILHDGQIESLKHFKIEMDSVKNGLECGICLDALDFTFQPQDLIVCYDIKEIDQEIDWETGF